MNPAKKILEKIRFVILITSDRAAQGVREDASGPLLQQLIEQNGGSALPPVVIPDEESILRNEMILFSRREDIDVILTSGGTGISSRDITVDVTRTLLEKEVPGFGEEMRRRSMDVTPYGILSRSTAGIFNGKFILNLPGSPQGAVDCLGWVLTPLSHLVRVLKKIDKECPLPSPTYESES